MLATTTIEEQIIETLEKVRPYLQQDGGDVEFVRYEETTRVVEVRLHGNCKRCPMSMMTLRGGIERFLLKAMPEIRRIEAVQ